ncbi:MAG: recombinase family protein [Clostridia bacterium]|jgi:DNA invertase Pin-like site-specific DNA recombinase|nr:recombinase family protein [Clostridia bacterium]MCI2000732.1 recombinase family protein [Clostridia bacterium]MCI2015195.1 recombinase family protein [Clostridia bacterium]
MDAIYLRQSVDKKDSISIETQLEKCLKESNGKYMVFSDKGFSGKDTNRPQFQKMMKLIKEGKINRIIVYRLDRFSRSIADFSALWQVLSANGVEFISVNERFDTSTPIGRAMLYIIMSFAQLERETIAERIRDNYFSRLEKGIWPGGPAPYGFDIIKKNIQGKNFSVLSENENAANVKEIFDLYSSEKVSLGEIGKYMRQKGDNNLTWNNLSVSRIIKCAEYAVCTSEFYYYLISQSISIKSSFDCFDGKSGGILCKKTFAVSFHKGIVDADTWIKCNEKIKKNSAIKNTGRGKYSFLSGMLKCGKCMRTVKIINSSGKLYLFCSGRTNGHLCKCDIKCDIKVIEKHVLKTAENILKSCVFQPDKPICNDEISKKIQRLIDIMCDCPAENVDLINERIKQLCKMKEKSNNPINIEIDFEGLDLENKKRIFRKLIKQIVVEQEKAIIYWNF